MAFLRNTFRRNGRGFTLIELLVVIAIIGILASIVLASLNSARRKSRDARRIADVKQIQLALELYADANGQLYPLATATCDTDETYGLEALDPQYIPTVPRDPNRTGADACYHYATNTGAGSGEAAALSNYHLGAFLEEDTNAALDGDRDCDSSAVDNCVDPSNAYTEGYDGADANCDETAGTGTDQCYDITN